MTRDDSPMATRITGDLDAIAKLVLRALQSGAILDFTGAPRDEHTIWVLITYARPGGVKGCPCAVRRFIGALRRESVLLGYSRMRNLRTGRQRGGRLDGAQFTEWLLERKL